MDPEVFRRIGLFVKSDFLDPDEQASLRRMIPASPRSLATVGIGGRDYQVQLDTRSTRKVDVSAEVAERMQARIEALTTPLGEHFGLELSGMQGVQFLMYEVGDFYSTHYDSSTDPTASAFCVTRRVSVVVFVNGEGDPGQGGYQGGQLTVYGTIGRGGKEIGLPLSPTPGLLVAFPSTTAHEVTPVTAGQRYSIVTWFV